MLTHAKRQNRKALSLAALEEQYFSGGIEAARAGFEGMADKRNDWAVIKTGQGTSSRRTDLSENSGISYVNYSPPAFWQPTYAVLHATLDPTPQADYVSHAGEEIVVPTEGKIRFHVFWSPGKKKPENHLLKEISFGSVLRLNPEVPHHAWGDGRQAKAWFLIRHASNTETAVSRDLDMAPSNRTKYHSSTKILTADYLKKPGRYALMAWGLAAKIKGYRERADLTIKKVAIACGIDHAHLSRIESGDTNISIGILLRLATYLRVDIGEFFTAQPWCNYIDELKLSQSSSRSVSCHLSAPISKHLLHATSEFIPEHATDTLPIKKDMQDEDMSSYIALSGRVIVEINGVEEILGPGAVMHLRGRQKANIQALSDSMLLQIIYSRSCSCVIPQHKSADHRTPDR
jgi:transcriptional regulator with XRE-family HTH domain